MAEGVIHIGGGAPRRRRCHKIAGRQRRRTTVSRRLRRFGHGSTRVGEFHSLFMSQGFRVL